jgi:hypothetical protein
MMRAEMGSRERRAVLSIVGLCILACDSTPTQVVLHIDADDGARGSGRTLRILVCDTESVTVLDRVVSLDASASGCADTGGAADGRVWWPVCVPLVPRGGAANRSYGVIAELSDASRVTHVLRASGGYVAGRRTDVALRFEDACAGMTACASTETCVDGRCVSAGAVPGVLERCGTIAPDGGTRIPPPVLRSPWNGTFTGSVHAPARSLRPSFRWESVATASRYEVQITDECETEGFAGCAFSAPEIALETAETTLTLEADLDADMTPPVGRRYFWRVRACDDAECSSWSTVRYLDVGRLGNDFDGDGYSDLLVSAPRLRDRTGEVYFYRGGPAGLAAPPTVIVPRTTTVGSNSWFGTALAAIGDVDADGYPDAAAGANSALEIGAGLAIIYRGGLGGIVPTREQVIAGPEDPGQMSSPLFGDETAGAGDVDADGYADVIVGARGWDASETGTTVPEEGRVFLYSGSRSSLPSLPSAVFRAPAPEPNLLFGLALASAGDLDGDGFHDIVLATQYSDVPDPAGGSIEDEGSAWVYRGPLTSETVSARLVSGLYQQPMEGFSVRFGIAVASAHDVDHDGFGDLLVGAPNATIAGKGTRSGAAYLFRGTSAGADPMATRLPNPGATDDGDFGISVASVGDLNGDGLVDLAVGAQALGAPTVMAFVHVYYGSPSGPGGSPSALPNPSGNGDVGYGALVGGAGDVNGDGFDDLVVAAAREPGTMPEEGVVYVFHGSASGVPTGPTQTLSPPASSTTEGGLFGDELSLMPP